MVTEHKIIRGRVPGQKAGKLAINIAAHEIGYLEMKINPGAGTFIAISGDCYYEAPTKAELKAHMEARARMARTVTWTRYLVLDYEANGAGGWSQRDRLTRDSNITLNDEGLYAAVAGLHLDWEILDISDPISVPGHSRQRKHRLVYANGEPGPERWYPDGDLPALAIPFSPEILETVKRLRHGLGTIHLGISKLLAGTPEAIATRLANPNTRLLGDGEA